MKFTLFSIATTIVIASGLNSNNNNNNPNVSYTCIQGCMCNFEKSSGEWPSTTVLPKPWTIMKTDKYAQCDNVNSTIREIFSSVPDDIQALVLRDSNVTNLMDVCCLNELRYLDLSKNQISDALAYYQFEKVVYLNLQSNNLRLLRKEEFMSFPNVEILNLADNNIHYVDQEAFRLMMLRQLILSRNKISYISERSFRFMPILEMLDISGNKLITLHNSNFFYSKRLRYVDLSDNLLMHIDVEAFEPLERVEAINLSYNNLSDLPPSAAFQKLPWLKHLSFDGNPVDTMKHSTFYNLAVQTMSFNDMPKLRLILAGAFMNLTSLRKLSFDNCTNLMYVSNEAFVNLSNTKEISLNNCSLTIVPTSFVQLSTNLDRIDLRNNPLSCECMTIIVKNDELFWRHKLFYGNSTNCLSDEVVPPKPYNILVYSSPKLSCGTRIIPSTNITLTKALGASVSLYCVVLSGFNYTVDWYGPNDQKLVPNVEGRFQITDEQLFFVYSLLNDSGRYQCFVRSKSSSDEHSSTSGSVVVSRYIDLRIENPNIGLMVEDVSSQWVYLRWNKSASDMHFGEYLLEYSIRLSDVLQRSYLPTVATTFRIADLKPQTNYTFCLIYQKMEEILYRNCIDVETSKHVFGFGVNLNYSLIVIVAGSVSLVFALCLVRCIHRHFHIWQEEKYRGRMQETMSAQGFLSSFESLNSGAGGTVAITYENPGALEALSDREEETALTSEPGTEPPTARSVPMTDRSLPVSDRSQLFTDRSLISKESQRKQTPTTIQHQATLETCRVEKSLDV